MAIEELYHGIVSFEVQDNNTAQRVVQLTQELATAVQGLNQVGGNFTIGDSLAKDLGKGEVSIERLIQLQGQLRSQLAAGGGEQKYAAELKALDALILKTEQLRRVQQQAASTAANGPNPVAEAQLRAEIARENARLRADAAGGAGPYASRVADADKRVGGADATLTKAQSDLAAAMEQRVRVEEAARKSEADLTEARRRLQAAARQRQVGISAQEEYNARPGARFREVRPGAADELAVDKAQRELAQAYEAQATIAEQQTAVERQILIAEERVQAAGQARAAAMQKAATATATAAENTAKVAEKQAAQALADEERRRVQGDPRRAGLLSQDANEFLNTAGIESSGSLKVQELEIDRQRLLYSRQGLINKIAEAKDGKELAQLIDQRVGIERRIIANTNATERQKFLEGGRGGFTGGLLGNFSGSPDGVKGNDLLFQAGQATKYFALYTAMSAVTQGIGQLVDISAQYSLAVTDLAVAMHISSDQAEDFAKKAAAIGAELGTGPLESIEGASKFARTFRDPVTQQMTPGALESGAQIASYINVLEGADKIPKVMQDMISLMRAYGAPATGAAGVYDKTQSISQLYGYQSGEVVGGAAALADLGKESGYSLEQLVALIASVMQQTGTTSDAAAGDVKRILGSQDSPEMNDAFIKYGVNLDLNFRERLDALSQVIEKLSPEERSKAITDLSADPRTGAVRAAILAGIPGARAAVEGAGNADGLVDRQVKQRLEEFGGELRQLQANLTQAALAIGDLGIVGLLTLLTHALNGLAGIVVDLSNLLGVIPGPAKEALAALVALMLAIKGMSAVRTAVAGSEILQGVGIGGGAASNAAKLAQLQTERGLAIATGQATAGLNAQIAATERAAAASLTLTGRMGAMGTAFLKALGPMVILAEIIAGLTLIGDANAARKTGEKAATDAVGASQALDKLNTSSDKKDIEAQIARLEASRKDIESTGNGVVGGFQDFITRNTEGGGTAGARQKIIDAINARIAEAKKTLDAIDARVAAISPQEFEQGTDRSQETLFGNKGQRVGYGVDAIKARGLSAKSGLNSLDYLIDNIDIDKLLPTDGTSGAKELIETITQKISRGSDPTQQQADYGRLRALIAELRGKAGPNSQQGDALDVLMEQANAAYLDTLISNTEARIANIKATQAEGPKAKAAINKLVTNALNATTAAGDVSATVKLLSMVDEGFLKSYRRNIEAQRRILIGQLEAIKKALVAARALARAANEGEAADHFSRMEESNPDPKKLQAQIDAQKQIDAYNEMLKTLGKASGLATYDDTATEWKKDKDDGPTAEEIEMARIAAQARPGDPYSQATTNLKLAKYTLAHVDNKKEYWDALKGLRDAQYELAQVELEGANQARILASDVTNPVVQAKLAVQAAKDKLKYDQQRGASNQVITADKAALKQAQASAASSAWSQQFGDMQTNYDLNRISLSAYLKYLNSQKAYLEAVKNKTRDQVEQLNQVDRALKGLADSLDSQWNLGDIKIPTPYEARKALAGGAGTTTVNNIDISGADMGQVLQLLQNVLGVSTVQAAASAPAKV